MDIFGRKIWRGIFGPVGQVSQWRKRYSKELHDIFHGTKLSVNTASAVGRPRPKNGQIKDLTEAGGNQGRRQKKT